MKERYKIREACFACTTPYQIIGAMSIVCSEKMDADIYVFGTFSGYEAIADRLRTLGFFKNVYPVNCDKISFFGKGMSGAGIKARALIQEVFPEPYFRDILDRKTAYSHFYSSSRAHVKVLLQQVLLKRNPDMRITIYDDGLGSYLTDSHVLRTSKDRRAVEKLLGRNLFDPEKVDIELYLPGIAQIPEELRSCPMKEMPRLDWNSDRGKNILETLYGIDVTGTYDERVILFDNVRGSKSRKEMFEKIDECYREIVRLAGKDNVLFKAHPRSVERPAVEMNIVREESVPMEVFYSNMTDLQDRVLVTYNSTATYTPKLLFDKEPWVINLHRIVGGPMRENSETLYQTFLPTYQDKGRLFAPDTIEELRHILNKIIKEEKQS